MTNPSHTSLLVPCIANAGVAVGAKSRRAAQGSSMQLTRAADYALRAMVHLALQPAGERALLLDLTRATEAPESFLSKVLQSLCRAGFVASHRGQSGGFEILAAGRAATVERVICAIEGPIGLNVCVGPDGACSRKAFCPVHPVWVAAQNAMLAVLRANTVADLTAMPTAARCARIGSAVEGRQQAEL